MEEYKISAQLLQAIVENLNNQPARQVRGILNAIEKFCIDQDVGDVKAQSHE